MVHHNVGGFDNTVSMYGLDNCTYSNACISQLDIMTIYIVLTKVPLSRNN